MPKTANVNNLDLISEYINENRFSQVCIDNKETMFFFSSIEKEYKIVVEIGCDHDHFTCVCQVLQNFQGKSYTCCIWADCYG